MTTGVYSIFKHPSYTGYYYFAIGSQIFLQNVISLIGVHCGLLMFYRPRVKVEEELLEDFFPREYKAYARDKGMWIPLY